MNASTGTTDAVSADRLASVALPWNRVPLGRS